MVTCTQTANERGKKVTVVSDSNNVWKKPLKDAGLWRWWREQWDYLAKYERNAFSEFAKSVYWQDDSLRSLKIKCLGFTVYNCTVLVLSHQTMVALKLKTNNILESISCNITYQKTWHLKVQHVITSQLSGEKQTRGGISPEWQLTGTCSSLA